MQRVCLHPLFFMQTQNGKRRALTPIPVYHFYVAAILF